jgi:hypothetical protein
VEGICTITDLNPYDQLFILMAAGAGADWVVGPIETGALADNKDQEIDLVKAWNSVCYAGADKATEEAVSDIESSIAIMYKLASDQTWRRYIPGRPEIPDTLTTLHRYDSVILLVTAEAGITWKFDP